MLQLSTSTPSNISETRNLQTLTRPYSTITVLLALSDDIASFLAKCLSTGLPVERTNQDSGKIVGGLDADIKDYPYQLSLNNKGHNSYCGGSIISPEYAVTAAHCVVGNPK